MKSCSILEKTPNTKQPSDLLKFHSNFEVLNQFIERPFRKNSYRQAKYSYQLYPTIPPNSLIATNLQCTEIFSYIKPLIHTLSRHPPHIFYVQTRLHHREKLIGYCHQRTISQLWSRYRHKMLVDANMHLLRKRVYSHVAVETASYSFV